MEIDPEFTIYDFAESLIKLSVSDVNHQGEVYTNEIEDVAAMFGVTISADEVLGIKRSAKQIEILADMKQRLK